MQFCIAIREPNKKLPDEFIARVLESFKVSVGYVSPQKGAGGASLHTDVYSATEYDLADCIRTIETSYADARVYYQFIGGDKATYPLSSLMPQVVLTNGKEGEESADLLAILAGGNFPDFKSDDVTDTNSQRFVDNYLNVEIAKLLDMSEGSLDQLMAYIEKAPFKDGVMNKLGPEDLVIVVSGTETGKAKSVGKDMIHSHLFDWGYASNHLGLVKTEAPPAAVAPPVAAAGKKPPLTMKKKNVATAEPGTAPPPPPAEQPGEKPATPPEVAYAPLLKNEFFYINPKGQLYCRPLRSMDWKVAKTFWNQNSTLPRPKDQPDEAQLLYVGFPFDSCRPDASMRGLKATLMGEEWTAPAKAASEQGPGKPEPRYQEPKPAPAPMTLFVPKDNKETFLNLMKAEKLFSLTDEQLKAMAAEYDPASYQVGKTLEYFDNLAPESLNRLPGHLKTCLLNEYRCRHKGFVFRTPTVQIETEKHILSQQELKPAEGSAGIIASPRPKLTMKKTG